MSSQTPADPNPRQSRPERINPDDERVRLRRWFICYYLQDEQFSEALCKLALSNGGVHDFCRQWGLTFCDDQVEAAVQQWCDQHRQDQGFSPQHLLACFHRAGFEASNYDYLQLKLIWDPTRESRAEVETRLLRCFKRQMRAALDTIADAYTGYDKPSRQRRPARARHMKWLFERQRFGHSYDSYEKIAKEYTTVTPAAVRQACRRLAKEMGLDLTKSGPTKSSVTL